MIFNPPTLILAYHRVCHLDFDPQLLAVSPDHFKSQMLVIKKYCTPIRLNEVGSKKVLFGLPRVAITFDDGYADNLYFAKPILEELEIPATFFVTSGMVGSNREFWWDELENIFLSSFAISPILNLEVAGKIHSWSELDAPDHSKKNNWNVLDAAKHKINPRQKAYLELSALIHPLNHIERENVLTNLFDWASRTREARLTHKALTAPEVKELNEGGLVEVGAHSVRHELFFELSKDAQKYEISTSKNQLEELLQCEVGSFAYPFGGKSHYSVLSPSLVREAGFKRACSNFPGLVNGKTDPFQLPRFLVRNWSGAEFSSHFKKWLRS